MNTKSSFVSNISEPQDNSVSLQDKTRKNEEVESRLPVKTPRHIEVVKIDKIFAEDYYDNLGREVTSSVDFISEVKKIVSYCLRDYKNE